MTYIPTIDALLRSQDTTRDLEATFNLTSGKTVSVWREIGEIEAI
jgi:hypothetical protein